jgi:hypothetical protein
MPRCICAGWSKRCPGVDLGVWGFGWGRPAAPAVVAIASWEREKTLFADAELVMRTELARRVRSVW